MAYELEPSKDLRETKRRLLESGTLYRDPDFPLFKSYKGIPLEWKRPKEIESNPKFIVDGTTRQDIHQGAVRDCFILSAVACLAVTSKEMLRRNVPPRQSFSKNYTGLFYFNFWRHNTWIEVWVDDRLPVDKRSGKMAFGCNRSDGGVVNEFWLALLEKAYAKLKGGYDSIDGGYINEGLVDLTGGISEKIEFTGKRESLYPTLFGLLVKTSNMASMMGCSVESDEIMEKDMGNGLYGGHAYSITNLAEIEHLGKKVRILRIRNPWGFKEWKGPWSDRSKEWKSVSDAVKRRLGFFDAEDGEFWMSYEDWLREFDELDICHLTPDAFLMELNPYSQSGKRWNTKTFEGEWIKGKTAGGCGNKAFGPHLFWTNPQHSVDVALSSNGDERWTVIISLNQDTVRSQDNNYISFKVFKVKHPKSKPQRRYSANDLKIYRAPKDYMNVREVTGHFLLPPGRYVVIPSTFQPGMEGIYSLRIFSEDDLNTTSSL